jgi:YidC/Oxa1 family membrane protein insertase
MDIWHSWTSLLVSILNLISSQLGVTEAIAIILLTLIARAILLPVSLTSAIRMEANKQKMKLLKPELDALKERHKNDSSKLASETMRLYREQKVRLLDRLTVANIGTQGVFGIGLFQVLSKATFSSKFLWIGSLAKPDLLLTVLVTALMLLGMALMPGATAEPSMLVMMAISVAVAAIAIVTLPSAVGIYWATSNAITVVQALILRAVVHRKTSAVA